MPVPECIGVRRGKTRELEEKLPNAVKISEIALRAFWTPDVYDPRFAGITPSGRSDLPPAAGHSPGQITSPFLSGRVEHEGSVMSKRIAFLLTGFSLTLSSVGCCCLGGLGNRCQPCGGCPTGGGAYYAPQSTMVQSYDQTAYSSGISQSASTSGAIIGAPIMASPGGYPQTVVVPTNTLPPY
jgi:hypothetical protein